MTSPLWTLPTGGGDLSVGEILDPRDWGWVYVQGLPSKVEVSTGSSVPRGGRTSRGGGGGRAGGVGSERS